MKNTEKHFPKETLNALEVFLVPNVEQYPTDAHSQELLYGNDEIKRRDHFQIGSEGMSQWDLICFEMTQLLQKWFLKPQVETN